MTAKLKVPLPISPDRSNGQETTKTPLSEVMPNTGKAQVTSTVKYEIETDKQKPPTRQFNPITNGLNLNQNITSDNPLLDFIEYWKDDESDCYVLLTRLPDNPLTPNEFYTACTSAKVFPMFPFNPSSLINDIIKVNGNSGGYFKIIMVDESMQDLQGDSLKRYGVANPAVNPNAVNTNNNENNILQMFQQMNNESEKRFQTLIETMNANKKDEFGEIAKTLLTKKLENIDKPVEVINQNPLSSLPPETQALVSMFQNPIVTKGAFTKINESLSSIFADKDTAETLNKTASWGDRIITAVMDNPELQGQLMTLADKAIGLIGLTISKFGNNKPNPKRRPPQQQTPVNQTQPPVVENDFIDVEANEIDTDNEFISEEQYQAELKAFRELPLINSIIEYVDSETPLSIDNEFMKTAKESNRVQFVATVAVLSDLSFEESLNRIFVDFPYVEEILEENPRRLERLKEFHALLKKG